jgi:hypothetical protein
MKAALCYTFGKEENLYIGEKYLQRAIEINPGIPSNYSIYAQNLLRQKK